MPKIHVMSVIGSAVPAPLRADGLLACWYVVSDGVAVSGRLPRAPPPRSKPPAKQIKQRHTQRDTEQHIAAP